jgi:hypothetical protein
MGLCLRLHRITQLENCVAVENPAFTLNDCQVIHVLDVYGQHGILQLANADCHYF